MRRGFARGETAVSDVIGTVLLLGITVSAFSVLAVAVLDQFERNPPPARIEFRVDSAGGRTSITATWGESIDVDDTRLLYELDGARTVRDLDVAPLSTNLLHRIPDSNARWDVGEILRLSCPLGEACAHPGARVTNVSVLQKLANTVLFSSEEGVSRGSVLNPVADLLPALESLRDPLRLPSDPLFAGGTIEAAVRVRNDGVLPIPLDRRLVVTFHLDGNPSPFHTFTQTGGLALGASFTATTPPFTAPAGAHTLRAFAEAEPAVIEAGYGNNEVVSAFLVVPGIFDPGSPYEDGNDDVLYNPYVASDVLLSAASVTDGVHSAATGNGLVIPASVGPVSPAGSISFAAPSGRLTIRVGLETVSSSTSIALHGATGLNVTGTFDVKTRDSITLTSGGPIDLSGIRIDTNGEDITVTSTGDRVLAFGTGFHIPGRGPLPEDVRVTSGGSGSIDVVGARFEASGLVRLAPAGVLFSQNTVVKAHKITYALGAGNTVYAASSQIDDGDDCADVNPSSGVIIGVPLSGRVATTC